MDNAISTSPSYSSHSSSSTLFNNNNNNNHVSSNLFSFVTNYIKWIFKFITFGILSLFIYFDFILLFSKKRKTNYKQFYFIFYLILIFSSLFLIALLYNNYSAPFINNSNLNGKVNKTNKEDRVEFKDNLNEIKLYIDKEIEKIILQVNSEGIIDENKMNKKINNVLNEINKELEILKSNLENKIKQTENQIQNENNKNNNKINEELKLIVNQINNEIYLIKNGIIDNNNNNNKEVINTDTNTIEKLRRIESVIGELVVTQDRVINEMKRIENENKDEINKFNNRISNYNNDNNKYVTREEIMEIIKKEININSKEHLIEIENKIKEMVERKEITKNKEINELIDQFKNEIKNEIKNNKNSYNYNNNNNKGEEEIKKMIEEAIRIYDSDRIGKKDYALINGGGSIIYSRTSKTYDPNNSDNNNGYLNWLTSIFTNRKDKINKKIINNKATAVIEESNKIGDCWPFHGSKGNVTIKLMTSILPTDFTLEHISPLISYNFTSCPKSFNVWGFHDEFDANPILLGNFMYQQSIDFVKPHIQNFPIKSKVTHSINIVTLEILSNYGNIDYTCIYRFRVHGVPDNY